MKKSVIISIATVVVFSLTACNKHENNSQTNASQTTTEQVAQNAKESAAKAAEAAKENASKAVEATKEAAAKASEAAKEVANKAKEAANKAAEAAKESASKAVEATKEAAAKASEAAKEVANKAKEAAAAATGADNSKGKTLFAKCQSCHGADGKTHALGKSAIIAGQNEEDLVKKIEAYKAGTRNVAGMGALMNGQVKNLSDEDIKALAKYISSLK